MPVPLGRLHHRRLAREERREPAEIRPHSLSAMALESKAPICTRGAPEDTCAVSVAGGSSATAWPRRPRWPGALPGRRRGGLGAGLGRGFARRCGVRRGGRGLRARGDAGRARCRARRADRGAASAAASASICAVSTASPRRQCQAGEIARLIGDQTGGKPGGGLGIGDGDHGLLRRQRRDVFGGCIHGGGICQFAHRHIIGLQPGRRGAMAISALGGTRRRRQPRSPKARHSAPVLRQAHPVPCAPRPLRRGSPARPTSRATSL